MCLILFLIFLIYLNSFITLLSLALFLSYVSVCKKTCIFLLVLILQNILFFLKLSIRTISVLRYFFFSVFSSFIFMSFIISIHVSNVCIFGHRVAGWVVKICFFHFVLFYFFFFFKNLVTTGLIFIFYILVPWVIKLRQKKQENKTRFILFIY